MIKYTANVLMKSLYCDRTVIRWCLSFHLVVALLEGYKTCVSVQVDSYLVTMFCRVPSHCPLVNSDYIISAGFTFVRALGQDEIQTPGMG